MITETQVPRLIIVGITLVNTSLIIVRYKEAAVRGYFVTT